MSRIISPLRAKSPSQVIELSSTSGGVPEHVIVRFLGSCLRSPRNQALCVRIALFRVIGTRTRRQKHVRLDHVRDWFFEQVQSEEEVMRLSQEMVRRVQDDAYLEKGRQGYHLEAYFAEEGEEKEKVGDHLYFEYEGEERFEEAELEAPNAEGLTAMAMRHSNLSVQMNLRAHESVVNNLLSENERLRASLEEMAEQNGKLRDRLYELHGTFEELHSKKLDREIAEKEFAARQHFIKELASQFKVLFPILLHKLGGKPLVGGDHPVNQTLKALFESLDESQLQGVLGMLNQDQQIAMLELYKQITAFEEESTSSTGEGVGT